MPQKNVNVYRKHLVVIIANEYIIVKVYFTAFKNMLCIPTYNLKHQDRT